MEESLEMPKVSIIIPTYNSGETLAECLKSIHGQNYLFYEVIVVDNFSSDDTLKIAKEFGAKIIQQKCNPALARNIGIANSTGKYILFLDSDQVLSPSVVEECVRKCENEKVGMVRIPEVFTGESFWSFCSAVWKNYYEEVERLYGSSRNIIHGEPRFFIKEQITRVGMLDTALFWGEDYDLYEKLKKANVKEAKCKSKIYHHELISIRKILIKNLRYGKSMPIFLQQTKKQVFSLMLRHALLTFREVFRNFKKSPGIIVGCAVLLCLKTYSRVIGLLIGLASLINKG
ncbi:MAG: glycosyltransferase family 2 protein [Candidatus Bathyarchaeota archaeon]|nr:glycosyltransferase family 2 protein [Candidatus Bathyarchaeota archaeon]